jgi:hypothetical protein
MSKKILIPTIALALVALVAGLWYSSDVYAQGNQPGQPGQTGQPNGALRRLLRFNAVLGQVTAVGQSDFTVQNRDGDSLTFKVDDNTRFRGKDKAELALDDLKTGAWVAVIAPRRGTEAGVARLVAVLPDDFDPAKVPAVHAGEIVSVDAKAGTLTLKTLQDGQELTFAADSSTRFRSLDNKVQGLGDLQAGLYSLVTSKSATAGGNPLAVMVAAGEKGDLRQFLQDRRDRKGQSGQSGQSGQRGQQNQGNRRALVDKVRQELAKYDQRLGGKIVTVTADGFTLENRSGKQYTLAVDSATLFRSRDSQVTGLKDLQAGMVVAVGANDAAGGGGLQAGLVLVIKK